MRQDRGFTLTELVITLAVGSILLSLAVPSFNAAFTSSQDLCGSEGESRPLLQDGHAARQLPGVRGAVLSGEVSWRKHSQ